MVADVNTASNILGRLAQGHSMTRRERIQLVKTTLDIFRLIPFSIFVIVPFMELLLPVFLKIFPVTSDLILYIYCIVNICVPVYMYVCMYE